MCIEIIDLKEDQMTIGFERPKVVFFIRIVGVTKVVVDRDGLNDSGHCIGAESGDATVSTA